MRILECAVEAFDVGIDQPELAIRMAQARCPDAATVRVAAHVQKRGAVQRTRHQTPIHQIGGVVDLHAGIPFKGRCGDVVIAPHPAERGIGIEAAQDGVFDHLGTLRVFHENSGPL